MFALDYNLDCSRSMTSINIIARQRAKRAANALFFRLQSLVRDNADRETLFRLDVAIQRVSLDKGPTGPAVLELTAVYHNLLRRWSEV